MDGYGARMAVAEIGSANNLERMIEYTRGSDRLHTAYSFVLLGGQPTAAELAALMQPWQEDEGATAWPSWAMSNHDAPRVATRWAQGDPSRTRQLLVLLACLRGTLFIYQGEELGLTQSEVAFENTSAGPVWKGALAAGQGARWLSHAHALAVGCRRRALRPVPRGCRQIRSTVFSWWMGRNRNLIPCRPRAACWHPEKPRRHCAPEASNHGDGGAIAGGAPRRT